MKKLIALVLSLMMVFSLATVASADGETGTITINNITLNATDNTKPAATYKLFKMLDLESYDTAAGAYSYKVNAAWAGFFATSEALSYVAIDEAGYVTWKTTEDEETYAEFAKTALAYAEENGIAPVKNTETAGSYTISTNAETGVISLKFADLELGYYLVDSSMGALCGLTTTNPDAYINTKNVTPIIDKQVQEDSTNQFGGSNTADIGQTVYFRTTIDVTAGAQNYVLHDKMSTGLTFLKVSKVEHVDTATSTTSELTANDDYVVKTTGLCEEGCTFELEFADDLWATVSNNDKLIVYYEAMLNRNAVIAGEGNKNDTFLEYGDNNFTTHDNTKTETFGFEIIKTDSQNTLIDGAEFRIYDAVTGGNEIAVVELKDADENPVLDKNGKPVYRRAREDETGVPIVVHNGYARVVGFDNGTYYLEETKAPEGYNKLNARHKFIVNNGNLDAIFSIEGIYSSGSGVHVVNKTGSMLPETGAMGTTMFLMFGSFVVLAAGVLLVTKKRMSMIEE